MSRTPHRPSLAVPIVLTIGIIAARLASTPPLSDPIHGTIPEGIYLATPWLYALFAPLFTLWDGVSMLGMNRLLGFLVGCLLLYVAWRVLRGVFRGTSWKRELTVLVVSFLLFVAFVVTGALWHRPMLALAGVPADDVVVDYHSHTNLSHDVRKTAMAHFDVAASRQWHARAGFDAMFVTDHNEVHPSLPADANGSSTCPGTEVSGWDAHIILLGRTPKVDRGAYARSLEGLLAMLRVSDSAYGVLSIASLPEYERSHAHRLDELVASRLGGFEIVNAAPKANEVPAARRDSVIALASRTNRLLVGVSDSHGWGATSMVWNLVRLPGWRASPATLCDRILQQLRTGTDANRIVERHRLRADAWWPRSLTPIGVLWETWRGMNGWLTASWLLWTWASYAIMAMVARRPGSAR